MKIYLYILILLFQTTIVFGFGLPFLISAKSTELVIGGSLLLAITPIIYYYSVKQLVLIIKNKFKNEECL